MASFESFNLNTKNLDLYSDKYIELKNEIYLSEKKLDTLASSINEFRFKYETAEAERNKEYLKYTALREKCSEQEGKIAHTKKILDVSSEYNDAYNNYINECKKYIAEEELNAKQSSDVNILSVAQNRWFFEALNDLYGKYKWDNQNQGNTFEGIITFGDVSDCVGRTYLDDNFGECCDRKYGDHLYIPMFHKYRPTEFSIRKPLTVIHGLIDNTKAIV